MSGVLWIWLANTLVALGSILWAEIVRDVRHWLAHVYPKLMPKHSWHHRVFRQDLSVIDPDFYRLAHWHHDVPEAMTMIIFGILLWGALQLGLPSYAWFAWIGVLYSGCFLVTSAARGKGWLLDTDLTHQPGAFTAPPGKWRVNRTYHWRHHFDDSNAYFCGIFSLVDQLMGTSLSLKGKTIAVTGASGSLGMALLEVLQQQGAKVIALSSQTQAIQIEGKEIPTLHWQVGQEQTLAEHLNSIDILILNHGVNTHLDRTPTAIQKSYEVNTFSSWRLLELFLTTVQTNADIACKEVWVNTSEAEVIPAVSPLYELSKRALGDLITLRRLDSPCVIRKLILGPFKSNLNPIGIMSAQCVARQIVAQAKRDHRNIVVTINPLTYLLFPWKEFWVSTYFKLFSRSARSSQPLTDPVVSTIVSTTESELNT